MVAGPSVPIPDCCMHAGSTPAGPIRELTVGVKDYASNDPDVYRMPSYQV